MLAHLGAFLGLLGAGLGGAALALSGLALAASLGWGLAGEALRRLPGSIVAIAVEADGWLRMTERRGTEFRGQPAGTSLVSPWCLVLTLLPEGGGRRRTVVVLPDSTDADALRRLRVQLRWRRPRDASQA